MAVFLPLSVCVKSSEVLVSLVSCTINTESVLNLRTTKTDRVRRCLLHLCHVRLVMSVVLFSVRIATSKSCSVRGDDWHSSGMLRQQYDTSVVVSARAHGSCSVPYSYGFFHQVDFLRTVSTKECLTERIDNQWHPCSVECTCTFA